MAACRARAAREAGNRPPRHRCGGCKLQQGADVHARRKHARSRPIARPRLRVGNPLGGKRRQPFFAAGSRAACTSPQRRSRLNGSWATAVQELSHTVPIVGSGLNAPVATGLAASLAHAGGNITGVATMAEDLQLKLFEMMRETLPGVRRVAAVHESGSVTFETCRRALRMSAFWGISEVPFWGRQSWF
jgi:ABC transporter substrate binding protein